LDSGAIAESQRCENLEWRGTLCSR